MSRPMEMALFPAIRSNRDLRSAMLALCALFLLTGLIGAFASTAAAMPGADDVGIHCYGGTVDESGGEAVPQCCTLGCPVTATALLGSPVHAPGPSARASLPADADPPLLAAPPSRLVALDTARGPPLPL